MVLCNTYDYDAYRPISLWVIPTCKSFTQDDVAAQHRHLHNVCTTVMRCVQPQDDFNMSSTAEDSRRSREFTSYFCHSIRNARLLSRIMPFYTLSRDEYDLAANFDNAHISGRLRGSLETGKVKISTAPLTIASITSLAAHLGMNVDPRIGWPNDKQNFDATYKLLECIHSVGVAAMECNTLPQQLREAAQDVFVLGFIVELLRSELFDVSLDASSALEKVVAASLGVFYVQRKFISQVYNMGWYI